LLAQKSDAFEIYRQGNQKQKFSLPQLPMEIIRIRPVIESDFDGIITAAGGKRAHIDAGCYFYGDGFDYYLLTSFEYVPINLANRFSSFEQLQKAWNEWAEQFATAMVRGTLGGDLNKAPQIDKQFDYEGVTFILPAPSMRKSSDIYVAGRPRKNTSDLERCPPIATTFPDLTEREWIAFRVALPDEPGLCETFHDWRLKRDRAARSNTVLCPFAPVPVTFEAWQAWCNEQGIKRSTSSVHEYANFVFNQGTDRILDAVREFARESIVPERYVLVVTEEIGQDKANDISHIAIVQESIGGRASHQPLVENARIFYEHAVVLGTSYAFIVGLEFVFWRKDLKYAWI
jgi:hypothetical protein